MDYARIYTRNVAMTQDNVCKKGVVNQHAGMQKWSQECMKREHAKEIAKNQPRQCAGKAIKKYVLKKLYSKCCKELDNNVCKETSDQLARKHIKRQQGTWQESMK